MKIKKFENFDNINESYGQEKPSSELMNLMFNTFRKHGEMIMEDEDVKKILEKYPDFKGIDNMKIGDYLVSIKINKI